MRHIMAKTVTKGEVLANLSGNNTQPEAKPPVGKKGGKNIITKTVLRDDNDHATGIRLDFLNGKKVEVAISALSADIVAELVCHGLAQKIGDGAAKSQGATVEDKFQSCAAIAERLLAGDWAAKREGAGEGVTGGLLANALAEITGKPIEEVRAFLKDLKKEERDALARDTAVKPVFDRLRAEREAKRAEKAPSVDTKHLLAGLLA
jgi:hypothetical protein